MEARWLALTVLTAARASMGFQFQSLASVAPLLIQDLALGYAEVGFLIGLYMLPGVVLALPGGVLGQRFGDTRVVVVGLALMTAGGALAGVAGSYSVLLAGRLASGVGAVLLNVLMTKMITDWFVGREIVLAMSVFINSFPIGIGLALLSLGWLAETAGWSVAFFATAGVSLAALLLVALVYQRHPNDGQAGQTGVPGGRVSGPETTRVCLAGGIWGLYNGAFAITLGFTPVLLTTEGRAVAEAGVLVGLATWLLVGSVQAGGLIAQRWGHPSGLLLLGVVIYGACLLLLPWTLPVPMLLLIGLFGGLPVGVIVSLPAWVLRPESRGVGTGVFYTWLYIGYAALPPIAGRLLDLSGSPAVPLYFAGGLMLSIVPVFAAFRALQGRRALPARAQRG
jgi:predicted MFS family arabinose efflux permease